MCVSGCFYTKSSVICCIRHSLHKHTQNVNLHEQNIAVKCRNFSKINWFNIYFWACYWQLKLVSFLNPVCLTALLPFCRVVTVSYYLYLVTFLICVQCSFTELLQWMVCSFQFSFPLFFPLVSVLVLVFVIMFRLIFVRVSEQDVTQVQQSKQL